MTAEVVLIPNETVGLLAFGLFFPPVACAAAHGCYLLMTRGRR